MKNDDHDFGGKMHGNDGGDAESDSPIGRELEARVVAAVAGEASPFEAAELERLAAENPALADFKRRIESVHGLVTEAARTDAQPLRLSAERRAKVLAAIGATDNTAKEEPGNVVAMKPASKPSLRRRVLPWALAGAAAACLPFVAVFLADSELMSKKPARPDPSQTVLGQRVVSEVDAKHRGAAVKMELRAVQKGVAERVDVAMAPPISVELPVRQESAYLGVLTPPTAQYFAPSPAVNGTTAPTFPANLTSMGRVQTMIGSAPVPEVTRKPMDVTFGGTAFDSKASAAARAATPEPPRPSEVVVMDRFEVSASREGSAMAIAASAAPIKATPPSLTEVAQLDTDIIARDNNRVGTDEPRAKAAGASDRSILNWGTGSTEPTPFNIAAGENFNFKLPAGGAVLDGVAQQNSPVTIGGAVVVNSVSGNIIDTGLAGVRAAPEVMFGADRIRKLNETPATGQQTQEAVALNEGVIKLSAFQVSSDKDTGYADKAAADKRQIVPSTGGAMIVGDSNQITTGGVMLSTLAENSDFSFNPPLAGAVSQGRLAQERGPQQELAKKRIEEAKLMASADKKQLTITEAGSLNLGSIPGMALTAGTLVGGEKEKADAPLARSKPAADDSLRLETSTATQSVSTFSLHVSDVSFRLAQAALARGEAPDAATIRPEEFYNAFNYGDPAPAVAEKVGSRIEQSAHPFLAQRNLLRIALKVAATGRIGSMPLRLTVLLDTSGSMEREDRAATVRQAMGVLVSLLGPNDRLTLIGFARQPRLLAEALPGDRAREVLDIIARTPAEGGTNMEEALKLATQLALRHREAKAQNRIVMLTDGAANLGNAIPEQLATRIDELRQRGIAFDACGVGLDGLDDGILEALTRKGDGRYTVLNSPDDAGAGFAQKLAGAFRPAAENVKVQVRFNPARVATYRLIGFEQHRLKEQDFRNDKVDAAELAAEEAGVALYQFEPLPQGEGDVGEVFVRFRDPATGAMVERSWTIPYEARADAFDRAAPSLQLAGVAAMLAEKLRADAGAAQINLRDFARVMSTLQTRYRNEPRVQELATMFAQTRRLTGQ